VFLLGALVTFVKLAEYATIIPGVALWALGGSVALSAALWASLSDRAFWLRVESARLSPEASHEDSHAGGMAS
jgi:paraquat-inducible protein A